MQVNSVHTFGVRRPSHCPFRGLAIEKHDATEAEDVLIIVNRERLVSSLAAGDRDARPLLLYAIHSPGVVTSHLDINALWISYDEVLDTVAKLSWEAQ